MDKGFRTAPLIRFIGKEDGLISYTCESMIISALP